MNILIVAAHPDDEVLGCGATAARLAREGHSIYISILGEGMTSRPPTPDGVDPSRIASLHDRAHRAAELLGSRDLFLHNLPDNRFDTLPLLEVVKIVEALVSRLAPEVIYTHHGGDLNLDHHITHRAVLTATRPAAGCPVRELYAFEVASSTEWSFQRLDQPFRPNQFVAIESTLEVKLAAMELYESEARPFPHPRSSEALAAAARRWGSVVGCPAAEAFELVRGIRV